MASHGDHVGPRRERHRPRHRRASGGTRAVSYIAGAATGTAATGVILVSAHTGTAAVTFLPASTAHQPGGVVIQDPRPHPVVRETRVAAGDTLWGIAREHCGNPLDWTGIYARNQDTIGTDPDLITPGQRLVLDCRAAVLAVTAVYVKPQAAPVPRPSPYVPAAPPPSSSGGVYSFTGLENLWVAAGGPRWAAAQAAAVAECESAGEVDAYNPSGASGPWQILGEVIQGNVFDPMVNARNAVAKFEASGDTWAQWVCKP